MCSKRVWGGERNQGYGSVGKSVSKPKDLRQSSGTHRIKVIIHSRLFSDLLMHALPQYVCGEGSQLDSSHAR